MSRAVTARQRKDRYLLKRHCSLYLTHLNHFLNTTEIIIRKPIPNQKFSKLELDNIRRYLHFHSSSYLSHRNFYSQTSISSQHDPPTQTFGKIFSKVFLENSFNEIKVVCNSKYHFLYIQIYDLSDLQPFYNKFREIPDLIQLHLELNRVEDRENLWSPLEKLQSLRKLTISFGENCLCTGCLTQLGSELEKLIKLRSLKLDLMQPRQFISREQSTTVASLSKGVQSLDYLRSLYLNFEAFRIYDKKDYGVLVKALRSLGPDLEELYLKIIRCQMTDKEVTELFSMINSLTGLKKLSLSISNSEPVAVKTEVSEYGTTTIFKEITRLESFSLELAGFIEELSCISQVVKGLKYLTELKELAISIKSKYAINYLRNLNVEKLSKLEDIELEWGFRMGKVRLFEDSCAFILGSLMKVQRLRKLKMILISQEIDYETFVALENGLSKLRGLEELSLNFDQCKVTDYSSVLNEGQDEEKMERKSGESGQIVLDEVQKGANGTNHYKKNGVKMEAWRKLERLQKLSVEVDSGMEILAKKAFNCENMSVKVMNIVGQMEKKKEEVSEVRGKVEEVKAEINKWKKAVKKIDKEDKIMKSRVAEEDSLKEREWNSRNFKGQDFQANTVDLEGKKENKMIADSFHEIESSQNGINSKLERTINCNEKNKNENEMMNSNKEEKSMSILGDDIRKLSQRQLSIKKSRSENDAKEASLTALLNWRSLELAADCSSLSPGQEVTNLQDLTSFLKSLRELETLTLNLRYSNKYSSEFNQLVRSITDLPKLHSLALSLRIYVRDLAGHLKLLQRSRTLTKLKLRIEFNFEDSTGHGNVEEELYGNLTKISSLRDVEVYYNIQFGSSFQLEEGLKRKIKNKKLGEPDRSIKFCIMRREASETPRIYL